MPAATRPTWPVLPLLLIGCVGPPPERDDEREETGDPAPEVSAETLCGADSPSGTLRVEPDVLAFGTVQVDLTVEKRVRLLPVGDDPLALCGTIQVGSGEFRLATDRLDLPLWIPPEGFELFVTFSPRSRGGSNGMVWLDTTEHEAVSIYMSGDGSAI
jgi:hypothetical protein